MLHGLQAPPFPPCVTDKEKDTNARRDHRDRNRIASGAGGVSHEASILVLRAPSTHARRRYDPPVRRPLRLALAVVGLAAVVYGAASIALGLRGVAVDPPVVTRAAVPSDPHNMSIEAHVDRRGTVGWLAIAAVALGIGLVAVSAWRRQRMRPSSGQ
jgi:hypothetical protein